MNLHEQALVLFKRVREDRTDVVQVQVHENLELLIFTEATIEQVLVSFRDFEKEDSTLDTSELPHDVIQMLDELRAFVLSSESLVHLLQLLEETSVELGVQLHFRELVLVILGVLVQNLADAHQLGQHVELVRVFQLEVLLFVEEKELDQVLASEESIEFRFFRNCLPHVFDHEVVEQFFICLLCLHKHPALLGKFVPEGLELCEHVPGAFSVGIVRQSLLHLLMHYLQSLDVDQQCDQPN